MFARAPRTCPRGTAVGGERAEVCHGEACRGAQAGRLPSEISEVGQVRRAGGRLDRPPASVDPADDRGRPSLVLSSVTSAPAPRGSPGASSNEPLAIWGDQVAEAVDGGGGRDEHRLIVTDADPGTKAHGDRSNEPSAKSPSQGPLKAQAGPISTRGPWDELNVVAAAGKPGKRWPFRLFVGLESHGPEPKWGIARAQVASRAWARTSTPPGSASDPEAKPQDGWFAERLELVRRHYAQARRLPARGPERVKPAEPRCSNDRRRRARVSLGSLCGPANAMRIATAYVPTGWERMTGPPARSRTRR